MRMTSKPLIVAAAVGNDWNPRVGLIDRFNSPWLAPLLHRKRAPSRGEPFVRKAESAVQAERGVQNRIDGDGCQNSASEGLPCASLRLKRRSPV
jgi:hypothetical protein